MTNSAEQELEGTIWAAMTAHKVTTKEPLEFIETIKAAAMAYAAGDSDALTETRRMILHEATRPERIAPPVVAGGGGQPARRELDPPGSRARPPVGATLSTGHCFCPAHRPDPVACLERKTADLCEACAGELEADKWQRQMEVQLGWEPGEPHAAWAVRMQR